MPEIQATPRQLVMTSRLARMVRIGLKTQTRRLIHPQPEAPEPGGKALAVPRQYGIPGEPIFIKEKWRVFKVEQCDPHFKPTRLLIGYGDGEQEWRTAPDEAIVKYAHDGCWKSSRFMPRWASRTVVELVKDVEVQKLQSITLEDVRAEGIPATWSEWAGMGPEMDPRIWDNMTWVKQWAFIWDALHAVEGFGWDADPWVYRLTFRRIKCPSTP